MMSHLKENVFPLDKRDWGVAIAVILFISYFRFLKNYSLAFQYLVSMFFIFAVLGIIKEIKGRSLKRPKLTLKVALIFSITIILYSLLFAFYWIPPDFFGTGTTGEWQYELKIIELLLLIYIANPLIISLAVLLTNPLSNFQKKRIIKKAAEKMRGLRKIKVIGITGSYGKTSTKEFLHAILSRKYKVVKTEGNNNTNIGVAYTVLNRVSDDYDYFICEMGAYKREEIKEICDIVRPEIGILTGINEQHIDLFGSQENIVKAKFELIEALPEDGLAVINNKFKVQSSKFKVAVQNFQYFSLDDADNIKVRQNYVEFECRLTNKKCHPEFISGSTGDSGLSDFNFSIQKLDCMGKYCDNKQKMLKQVQHDTNRNLIKFKLNILGRHYIENIISAIIVAERLGMILDEIKSAVEKIKPTEYMIRKSEGFNSSVFIDDSYSANPDGVLAALDYLSEAYAGYKKIIVFPGIIELGKKSGEAHKKLFEKIGEICDIAYILETGNCLPAGKAGKLEIRNSLIAQKLHSPKGAMKPAKADIENIPIDKGGRGVECQFVFEKDFDKVAKMLKNDLTLSSVRKPPQSPLSGGRNTVVLFESRGAGAVMGKLKMKKSK